MGDYDRVVVCLAQGRWRSRMIWVLVPALLLLVCVVTFRKVIY